VLAHHALEGGLFPKAVNFLEQAGDAAVEGFDAAGAAGFFRRSLRFTSVTTKGTPRMSSTTPVAASSSQPVPAQSSLFLAEFTMVGQV